MHDEPPNDLLATLLEGIVTENVWRAIIRGEAAKSTSHWFGVTPAAALEVQKRGQARGARPTTRIRLAKQEAGANREMFEWVCEVGKTDLMFDSNGIQIAIDPVSLRFLTGLTLDFVDGAFRIDRLTDS